MKTKTKDAILITAVVIIATIALINAYRNYPFTTTPTLHPVMTETQETAGIDLTYPVMLTDGIDLRSSTETIEGKEETPPKIPINPATGREWTLDERINEMSPKELDTLRSRMGLTPFSPTPTETIERENVIDLTNGNPGGVNEWWHCIDTPCLREHDPTSNKHITRPPSDDTVGLLSYCCEPPYPKDWIYCPYSGTHLNINRREREYQRLEAAEKGEKE